jgi:hypothetical protein
VKQPRVVVGTHTGRKQGVQHGKLVDIIFKPRGICDKYFREAFFCPEILLRLVGDADPVRAELLFEWVNVASEVAFNPYFLKDFFCSEPDDPHRYCRKNGKPDRSTEKEPACDAGAEGNVQTVESEEPHEKPSFELVIKYIAEIEIFEGISQLKLQIAEMQTKDGSPALQSLVVPPQPRFLSCKSTI